MEEITHRQHIRRSARRQPCCDELAVKHSCLMPAFRGQRAAGVPEQIVRGCVQSSRPQARRGARDWCRRGPRRFPETNERRPVGIETRRECLTHRGQRMLSQHAKSAGGMLARTGKRHSDRERPRRSFPCIDRAVASMSMPQSRLTWLQTTSAVQGRCWSST